MQLISAHNGKLLTLNAERSASGAAAKERTFSCGIADLDAIAPGGAFARGAVHELLTEPHDGLATFLAMALACGSLSPLPRGEKPFVEKRNLSITPSSIRHSEFSFQRFLIWCDPAGTLYPPALAAQGVPLHRLLLLYPKSPDPNGKELLWAMTECLRCKGVGAVVGAVPRLSRLAARRLQLAAETGGSVGLLLRHVGRDSLHHAAASRWLVRPAPGGRTVQRWTIQLLHGHGGRIGQTLCLEHSRETNHLHPFDPVANRSTAQIRAS